jgi:hypothetical protein
MFLCLYEKWIKATRKIHFFHFSQFPHNFRWPDYSNWFIFFWIFSQNQVCQPRMLDGTNCSDPRNLGRYIEDFTCAGMNSSARMLKEMRLSFPSGHSSFSFYTMLFCTVSGRLFEFFQGWKPRMCIWVYRNYEFCETASNFQRVSISDFFKLNLTVKIDQFSPRFIYTSGWFGRDRNSSSTPFNLSS